MPELPEVETVRNTLIKHLKNRNILSVEVFLPRMILSPLDEFLALKNVVIEDIKRKGKYLLFCLSSKQVLISHLRMEGKYYYVSENDENIKHTRVVFHMDNNEKVLYVDSRSFGIMELIKEEDLINNPSLKKLGLEPFDADSAYLFSKLQHKNETIKQSLLDQSILAGFGNIYVDEVLFATKINPFTPSKEISLDQTENILIEGRRILLEAIKDGGSTVDSYHPENGVDGKFQNHLNAYSRKGLPCKRCLSIMAKDFINGRGTVYCPNCQNVAIRIGIYGKIASGKSTLTRYYGEKFKTFSCDEYISNLYKNSLEFKKRLIEEFSEGCLNDDGKISKNYIKNEIVKNPDKKKVLENIIHPLVQKAIEEFIRKNKFDKAVIVEVPLMFESKMNTLFDYIIGVDASFEVQLEHLRIRGSKNPAIDLKLNSSNMFDKYASKCSYLIHNNSTIEDLKAQADEILAKILNQK